MGTASPSNRASLLLGHCAGVFAKQIDAHLDFIIRRELY
jgi:hypothetical protein